MRTLSLLILAAAIAAAQSAPPPSTGAPVKFTALKNTVWPPKAGIRTPGVQVPVTTLRPETEVALGGPGGAVLFAADQALISVPSKDQVVRVEGRSGKVLEPFGGATHPCGGLANAFRNLWVVNCGAKSLVRLDAASGKVVATVDTGTGAAPLAIAASADSIWMLTDDKTTLSRIDPETNAIVSEMRLPAGCRSLTFAENSLWIACPADKRIIRLNPQTQQVVARIEVTAEPVSVTFGGATAAENAIWVLSRAQGKVARIDVKTNKVTATVDLGIPNADGSLAFGDGFVWVSAPGFPITKISPELEKEKVVQQFAGEGGGQIYFGLNSIWLANTAQNNIWRIDPKRIAATLAE